MPNPEVLQALLVKVDRAYEHIINLNVETLRFLGEGGPYKTIFEDNTQAGERTYYLRVLKQVPPRLSAIVGDIAQNLRSSLDHLAWHLVKSSPVVSKAEDRDVYFPIFETASKYHAHKMRKIQGMTDVAIKAIDRIEPYYTPDVIPGIGEGAFLFWLDEVNRLDKHRLLVPIVGNMVSYKLSRSKVAELPAPLRSTLGNGDVFIASQALTPGPLRDGSKLCALPISEVDDDMTFRFQIAFGEPKWVCGKEIHTTFAVWHKRIREIMISFDNQGLL